MEIARKLITKYSDTQTLPHVVTRLSSLINDDNSTMKDFEDVIKMDPILVVRILRLVNSPFFGLSRKVETISRAVAYLGMKNLHNLAVTDALRNIFKASGSKTSLFSHNQLWLHSAAVSICSKLVAERFFGINGDDAYLGGILHDIGIIVEEQVAKSPFIQACTSSGTSGSLDVFERQYLGTDHCEIGFLLTRDWDMPVAVQVAIRDHHTLLDDVIPESPTGILQIAEYIMSQLGYSNLSGAKAQIPPVLKQHISDNIDEYKIIIDDLPEEMEKAKDLYGTSD